MDSRDFYTTTELAKLLGISRIAVFNKIQNSQIKALKMGRNFIIFKEDIKDLESLSSNLFKFAKEWTVSGQTFPEQFYCQNSGVFQARLVTMETLMFQHKENKNFVSLLVSIAGEIGNNSYDHNIGQWMDTPGVFFGYNLNRKQIVLADRGLGILTTLKRVKSEIIDHKDALRVAFTEIISGRQPEARGNGLKYVKKVVSENKIDLVFQTGNAKLTLTGGSPDLNINEADKKIRGCLVFITY